MGSRRKFLFLQHANVIGGSVVSLGSLILSLKVKANLDAEFVVILLRYSDNVKNYYENLGIKVRHYGYVPTFEHSTAKAFMFFSFGNFLQIINFFYAHNKVLGILKNERPDIVHLNSTVLSASVLACRRLNIQCIWHIREYPIRTLLNFRNRILLFIMNNYCEHSVFISETYKLRWGNPSNSVVIYNKVNFKKNLEVEFKLSKQGKKLQMLFVGGYPRIKGGQNLLRVLYNLRNDIWVKENVCVTFLGTIDDFYNKKKFSLGLLSFPILRYFGIYSNAVLIEFLIDRLSSYIEIVKLPFVNNVEYYMSTCDVLVFPATRAHFARPVFEAAFYSKPVIVSESSDLVEFVDNCYNGLVLNFKSSDEFLRILKKLGEDKDFRMKMGFRNNEKLEILFSSKKNDDLLFEIFRIY